MKIKLIKLYKFLRKIGFKNKLIAKIIKLITKRKYPYLYENNILITEYNTIYFPVAKVATTSIKNIFIQLMGGDDLGKRVHKFNFRYVKKDDIDGEYAKCFKFCFVRNPYDRLVSCFENKILKKKENRDCIIDGVHKSIYILGDFYAGMSFKDFVIEICKIDDSESDEHFMTQNKILSNKNGIIEFDFIGKFENLENDFKIVLEKMGVKRNIKLPHLMKSNNKNYRKYYDEGTKKLVEERYKKDLELFDYTF